MWERVETAAGMRAALEKTDWDIIISDYQMPAFDAPAALTILQGAGRELPFLCVSGHIGEETAARLMRAGARDFVMKKNLARLAPAVKRELAEARARREYKEAQEQLSVSQHMLERILGATPNLIYIYDIVERRNVYSNGAIERFLGYAPGQIQALGAGLFQKILHPDDADLVVRHHARLSGAGDNEVCNASTGCGVPTGSGDGCCEPPRRRVARGARGGPGTFWGPRKTLPGKETRWSACARARSCCSPWRTTRRTTCT